MQYDQPRGRGIQGIPEDTPLACWLPVKNGLTPHGLRHSHKTWMAEDGIPEILAEQRLGHEVPGMRGLYAHASDRMRDDLKQALDGLLAPHRERARETESAAPRITQQDTPAPEDREKMISQIPPSHPESPTLPSRVRPVKRTLTWSETMIAGWS